MASTAAPAPATSPHPEARAPVADRNPLGATGTSDGTGEVHSAAANRASGPGPLPANGPAVATPLNSVAGAETGAAKADAETADAPPSSRTGAAAEARRAAGSEPARAASPTAISSSPRGATDAAPAREAAAPTVQPGGGAAPGSTTTTARVPSSGGAASAAAPAPPILLAVAPGLEVQLAAKAREFLERGQTELRISLDPPSLGKLRVHLELSEGRAVAHIVAASPEAAALLSKEREDLLRAFQQQGFEQVDVRVDSDAESAARSRHGREGGDNGPRDGSAPSADGTVRLPRRANVPATQRVDLFV